MVKYKIEKDGKAMSVLPGLTLQQQYIFESALNCGYFEKMDRQKLKDLSSELNIGLKRLEKEVDGVAGKVYGNFLLEFIRKVPIKSASWLVKLSAYTKVVGEW